MPRYHLTFPDYRPVLLAPDQPSPIGGTWRPAKYTEIGGQVHFGLACEQAGPTFNGHRCRCVAVGAGPDRVGITGPATRRPIPEEKGAAMRQGD